MNSIELGIGFILGYALSSAIDWILVQRGILKEIPPKEKEASP